MPRFNYVAMNDAGEFKYLKPDAASREALGSTPPTAPKGFTVLGVLERPDPQPRLYRLVMWRGSDFDPGQPACVSHYRVDNPDYEPPTGATVLAASYVRLTEGCIENEPPTSAALPGYSNDELRLLQTQIEAELTARNNRMRGTALNCPTYQLPTPPTPPVSASDSEFQLYRE